MHTSDRLVDLRNKMSELGVDACIIPSGDPHLSEYPSEHWKVREWISGFTGSAGTIVVTMEEAGLWTDSRYYLQAEEELDLHCMQLFRDGEKGVPSITEWLCEVLMPGSRVAINGQTVSVSFLRKLTRELRSSQIRVDANLSLAEDSWENRPALPENTVYLHDDKLAGASRTEKLDLVRKLMKRDGVSHYITGALDEIAWLLNMRGNDVAFNPVFHAFMIVEHSFVKLFINPHKLTAQIARKLDADDIRVSLYENFESHVREIPDEATVMLDPDRINSTVYAILSPKTNKIEGLSYIAALKARKNETEIANIKQTLVNDGVAMVKFLKWIEDNVPGGKVSEISAAARLKAFRAEQPGFVGESFRTISGYAGHGAIVHYSVSTESDVQLKPEGLYLVDSGGQYHTGTTDITRTVALGPFPEQARRDYTLVLKGHISLARAIVPHGTRGVQLDVYARQAMWREGLNYGHGTGHGIGYFLNVHEGPQSIRPDNSVVIEPGMVCSNEPGLYRTGHYGIRIENLILAKVSKETEFGTYLEFETMTLCPIDKTLIDKTMLTEEEINWLNNYHRQVYDSLAPKLDEEHLNWLKEKTTEL